MDDHSATSCSPVDSRVALRQQLIAVERKRRSRFIHKYSRSKVGKQRKEEIIRQRKDLLSVTRPPHNPLAHSQWRDPDSSVPPGDLCEDRKFRTRLLSAVSRVQKATSKAVRSESDRTRSCLRSPKKPLDIFLDALHKAEDNGRAYTRQPFPDPVTHPRAVHKHRRRVAGIEQEFSLWFQGEDVDEPEKRAGRLILLGHRVNLKAFRALWDETTFTFLSAKGDLGSNDAGDRVEDV
ncbi:hypothetical protein K488DRAFT_91489 [Vararia minispora EC-137]|uniref:Uncharacterized protein n=1 Tax=Vararia minispora EC-137 TaxID=1314806 RepID=A0ACB8Q6A4_9AGAM|nr:hypothetical protein K488DRAFT_91489 [Vararia minispora EC-137]